MKKFDIPVFYRSSIITQIKERRKSSDPKKKDFTPAVLDFGSVQILLARHFGFCYGVENAIEIAYRTIEENPRKRIFLLSEMIHNPGVNEDLRSRGVRFLMDTAGNEIFNWDELTNEDVVIIPAFGTTLEIEQKLNAAGINPYTYNTTCPFVEKVWNRAAQLGGSDYTVVIHGKSYHEETRATFSHTVKNAPSIIVKDIEEAKFLSDVMLGVKSKEDFYKYFAGKYSAGFNPEKDFNRIGVVNQTTMLANETAGIAEHLKETLVKKYGIENIKEHFADTRDTLCYATNDNQDAIYGLLNQDADIAVVVGGYNSSNTTHLVELCSKKFPVYFISSADKILSPNLISHFNIETRKEEVTENFLPVKEPVKIILTGGASCPDAVIEQVLLKLVSLFGTTINIDTAIEKLS